MKLTCLLCSPKVKECSASLSSLSNLRKHVQVGWSTWFSVLFKVTPYDENIDFVLFDIFIDLYRGARNLSISAIIF